MKFLLLLGIWLVSYSTCNHDLNDVIEKATTQAYSGGAYGSNSGSYYWVYLKMKNDTAIQVDSLWVDNRRMKATKLTDTSMKDETVIFANKIIPSNVAQKASGVDTAFYRPPVSGSAAGVVGIFYKGKRRYLIIQSWMPLPGLK